MRTGEAGEAGGEQLGEHPNASTNMSSGSILLPHLTDVGLATHTTNLQQRDAPRESTIFD